MAATKGKAQSVLKGSNYPVNNSAGIPTGKAISANQSVIMGNTQAFTNGGSSSVIVQQH